MRQKWFLYATVTFLMPFFKEQVRMAVVLFLNHLIIQSYYDLDFKYQAQQTKIQSFQSLAESLVLDILDIDGTKTRPNFGHPVI